MTINNKLAYIIAIILLLSAAAFAAGAQYKKSIALPRELSQWQAVFLSDGQVYFGRLSDYNRKFYLLTEVHYLKYGASLQQAQAAQNGGGSEQKLNLIKLGGELHGPQNLMYIAKDKVMFIENLKDSSPVAQAIKK